MNFNFIPSMIWGAAIYSATRNLVKTLRVKLDIGDGVRPHKSNTYSVILSVWDMASFQSNKNCIKRCMSLSVILTDMDNPVFLESTFTEPSLHFNYASLQLCPQATTIADTGLSVTSSQSPLRDRRTETVALQCSSKQIK